MVKRYFSESDFMLENHDNVIDLQKLVKILSGNLSSITSITATYLELKQ